MRLSNQVTFVRYGFFALKLFKGYDELNRYDVPASARKYAELCEQRLQAEYPRAKVEVVSVEDDDVEGALPGPMQTQVLVSAGDEVDSPVPLELEDSELGEGVDQICKEVFESYEWLVPRLWSRLEEASKRLQIPIPALRWLCANGFIPEAERAFLGWECPQESLTVFRQEHKELCDPESILSVMGLESETVSFRPLPGEMLFTADWPAPDEVWIAPTIYLEGLPFNEEDWSVIVDAEGIALEHHFCATRWEATWTYPYYAQAMVSEARNYGIAALVGDSQMTFKATQLPVSLLTAYHSAQYLADELGLVQQSANIALSGEIEWKPEYEQKGNEELFCKKVLWPLLKRKFPTVRYVHGSDEYGRDFIFSEPTAFGDFRHYGLQAKSGDLSGQAGSQIEKLVTQIQRAFSMPFHDSGDKTDKYISTYIIAISGKFTRQADEIIRHALPPKGLLGSIYFWDKDKISELIRIFWH
jgi:hypothetical protein